MAELLFGNVAVGGPEARQAAVLALVLALAGAAVVQPGALLAHVPPPPTQPALDLRPVLLLARLALARQVAEAAAVEAVRAARLFPRRRRW